MITPLFSTYPQEQEAPKNLNHSPRHNLFYVQIRKKSN